MEIFLRYILPVLGIVIVAGIPFVYVVRSGKLIKGVLLTWVLLVGWMFILSILVYYILWKTHQELCIEYLPEGNSIVGALFAGWVNGLIVSAFAMGCRFLILKVKR